MSKISFAEDAWNEYLYWQTQDKKTLRKINALLKDIQCITKLGFLILESKHKLLAVRHGFDDLLAGHLKSLVAFGHAEKTAIESHQIVFHLRLLTLRCTVVGGRGAAICVVQQLQQPRLEATELRTVTVAVMVDDRALQGQDLIGRDAENYGSVRNRL